MRCKLETILFIDDQPFERAEVQTRHPAVRTYDPSNFSEFRANPAFNIPVTEESHRRREMYQEQIVRNDVLAQSEESDFEAFLKNCNLEVTLEPLSDRSLNRAFELAQRTNQMNFSGRQHKLKETDGTGK